MAPSPYEYSFAVNIGSPFFGTWISAILFGFLCLQTWRYFRDYPDDDRRLKAFVLVLWLFDATDLGLLTYDLFQLVVLRFDDLSALVDYNWSAILHCGVAAVITLMVQLFFVRRIWILSNNNRLVSFASIALSFVALGGSLHWMIKAFIIHDNPILLPRFSKGLFLSSNIAADILIAGSQAFYLWRKKSGVKRTDVIVRSTILYIINTMLLTSAVSALELVLWVTRDDSTNLIPDWFLCRIYSNSLMAVLNTRQDFRSRAFSLSALSEFRLTRNPESIATSSKKGPGHGIMIQPARPHPRVVTMDLQSPRRHTIDMPRSGRPWDLESGQESPWAES